jgi:hypothetical protein
MRTPFPWLCPSIWPARRAIDTIYRLDGNAGDQLVKETLPALAAFRDISPGNGVGEFQHSDDGNSDPFITRFESPASRSWRAFLP